MCFTRHHLLQQQTSFSVFTSGFGSYPCTAGTGVSPRQPDYRETSLLKGEHYNGGMQLVITCVDSASLQNACVCHFSLDSYTCFGNQLMCMELTACATVCLKIIK